MGLLYLRNAACAEQILCTEDPHLGVVCINACSNLLDPKLATQAYNSRAPGTGLAPRVLWPPMVCTERAWLASGWCQERRIGQAVPTRSHSFQCPRLCPHSGIVVRHWDCLSESCSCLSCLLCEDPGHRLLAVHAASLQEQPEHVIHRVGSRHPRSLCLWVQILHTGLVRGSGGGSRALASSAQAPPCCCWGIAQGCVLAVC